jgi:uncharacterized protein DUF4388
MLYNGGMDNRNSKLTTMPLDEDALEQAVAQPLLTGTLTAFKTSALLSLLNVQKQTGLLAIHNRGFTAEILVEDGEVVDARLGVSRGLYALFEAISWNEGIFFFFGAPIGAHTINLSLPVIQVRAALWLDRWRDVLQTIPSLGHRIIVSEAPHGDVVIKPYQWVVLTRIVAGPITVAELALALNYPALEVMRACAELLQVGLCNLLPPLDDGWVESKVLVGD